MAFGFQMRNDVVFGAPLVDFLFGGSLQRIRGHERRMHEHQRPHLLHSETRGNWRYSWDSASRAITHSSWAFNPRRGPRTYKFSASQRSIMRRSAGSAGAAAGASHAATSTP